jgi:hypothetical protein
VAIKFSRSAHSSQVSFSLDGLGQLFIHIYSKSRAYYSSNNFVSAESVASRVNLWLGKEEEYLVAMRQKEGNPVGLKENESRNKWYPS